MDNVNEKIKDIINKNNIVLFMKGTPEAPQCGFSMTVSNILKHLKVKFEGVNVLESNEMRQGIKDFTDWPTIPQLYVKGEFVGGCDIIKEMFETGELKSFLQKKSLLSWIIFNNKLWFHNSWIWNFRKFWNSYQFGYFVFTI